MPNAGWGFFVAAAALLVSHLASHDKLIHLDFSKSALGQKGFRRLPPSIAVTVKEDQL